MERAGIYVHIPFCLSRCSYCDFATGMYEGVLAARYVAAVVREIESFPQQKFSGEVDTVYLGGGTPSLLAPAQVEEILGAVRSRFTVTSNAEVTMEMNPGGLRLEVIKDWRSLGVNRASFGAQTFDDDELKRLGRRHTAADVRATINLLREAEFDNVSFDLIAGLPAQTLEAWERNLGEALALRPEHLSLYLLDVHEGTPLADQIKRGAQPRPDEDLAAEMYELMLDKTAEAGYEHYEISNFCRKGFQSRHNSKYWTGAPVYGFGSSAHSFDGARTRWSNERQPALYTQMIESGKSPVVETVELDERARRAEMVFLGLRLLRGVDLRDFRARFGSDLREEYEEDLNRLSEAGLIEFDDDLLKLTRHGALLSNEVFATFV